MVNLLDPTDLERSGLAKVSTLKKWRITGEGPRFIRAGRFIKYDPADVAAWIESRKASSTSEVA